MKTDPKSGPTKSGQRLILPAPHARSLSVSVHYLEKMVVSLEELLRGQSPKMITERVEESFTEEERTRMLNVLADIRAGVDDMMRTFNLEPARRSEAQIVMSHVTHLWTILVDSRSEAMIGYGVLSDDLAVELDKRVETLIDRLDRMRASWPDDTRAGK